MAVAMVERVNVFAEVRRLATPSEANMPPPLLPHGGLDEVPVTAAELEEIRKLTRPPPVVRRTLELTYLILNASRSPAPLAPPAWARVQRRLASEAFLQEVWAYDAGKLRDAPALVSLLACTYFGLALQGVRVAIPARRRAHVGLSPQGGTTAQEPLSFHRVSRASRAAAALFRWCADVLVRSGALEVDAVDAGAEDAEACAQSQLPLLPSAPASPSVVEPPQLEPTDENSVSSDDDDNPVIRDFMQRRVLRAWHALTAASRPDRHFEVTLFFCIGRTRLTLDQRMALHLVICMHRYEPRFRVELENCIDVLEGDLQAAARLRYVQANFFGTRGISATSSQGARFATIASPAGITCKLGLNDTRPLRDLFLQRQAASDASLALGVRAGEVHTKELLLAALASEMIGGTAEELNALRFASQGCARAERIMMTQCPVPEARVVLTATLLEIYFQTYLHGN